ncbi:unnamed protein product [Rhizophagus irregularis]|nr:unnamed protein product [Rhizophagus irregularis]
MKAFGGLGGFLIFVLAFDYAAFGGGPATPHGKANEGDVHPSVSGNILGTLGAADTDFAFSNKSLQFELWHR